MKKNKRFNDYHKDGAAEIFARLTDLYKDNVDDYKSLIDILWEQIQEHYEDYERLLRAGNFILAEVECGCMYERMLLNVLLGGHYAKMRKENGGI